MNETPRRARAGWYPDETLAGSVRYWDGRAWTDHRAPAPAATVAVVAMPAGTTNAQRPLAADASARRGYWRRYRDRYWKTGLVTGLLTVVAGATTEFRSAGQYDLNTQTVVLGVLIGAAVGALVGVFIYGTLVTLVVAAFPSQRR